MNAFTLLFALYFSFYVPPPDPAPQQLHYLLYSKRNERVGEIKCSKTYDGNQVIYEAETHIELKVIAKQELNYHVKAIYKNGILVSCTGDSYFNSRPHSKCKANWTGNRYEIKKDSTSTVINRAINYSGAVLYFQEPPVNGSFFSEINGYESNIMKTAENAYTMTDSKTRKQNKYVYKGGILQSAFIDNAVLDIIVQLDQGGVPVPPPNRKNRRGK